MAKMKKFYQWKFINVCWDFQHAFCIRFLSGVVGLVDALVAVCTLGLVTTDLEMRFSFYAMESGLYKNPED